MGGRLIRDESGMTLILAVLMVVLVGVMGAGLLTFVRSDLDTVIEDNKAQKALDIADAGVQAAKAHLRVDSIRQHYDTNRANDCAEGPRVGGENWSKATDIYTDPNGYCIAGTEATRAADQVGVTKNFGSGKFQVTIECYDQAGDNLISPDPCDVGAGAAPEGTVVASDKKFFKITSTGYDTTSGDGAIRKIEAIYSTSKQTYVPIAYWTPKSINFSGTKCVSKLSFYAGGNISNVNTGDNSACGPGGFIADRTTPALYGDWYAPPYNTTRRVDAGGNPVIGAGFGAIGRVCGGTQCTSDANSVADGYLDYDRTTGSKGQTAQFVGTSPTSEITFPFSPRNALTPGNANDIVDPGLVDEMRAAAADQGNYHLVANGTTYTIDAAHWPVQGSQKIVYFVDYSSATDPNNKVEFKIKTPKGDPFPQGVIIVRNGNFTFSNAFADSGFQGVIIVIGDGTNTGQYKQAGSFTLDGYVAASGDMTISGNVTPSTTVDFSNLNSFYDVKLWSWRELYQK